MAIRLSSDRQSVDPVCRANWRRLLLAALRMLALVALLLAPGCGGGDDSGTGGDPIDPDDPTLINGNANGGGTDSNTNAPDNTPPDSPTDPLQIALPDEGWQTEAFRRVGPFALQRSYTTWNLRHADEVRLAQVSPDGDWLATASVDNSVRVWELDTGREVAMFQADVGAVTSLAWALDSVRLLMGSTGGHVVEWHVAWDRYRYVDAGQTVAAVGYLDDAGRRIGAVGDTAAFEWVFPAPASAAAAGALNTPGANSGNEGLLVNVLPPVEEGGEPRRIPIRPSSRQGAWGGSQALFSPDGSLALVVDDRTEELHLLNTRNWALRKSLSIADHGVAALATTPDGGHVAVLHERVNRISLFSESGQRVGVVRGDSVPEYGRMCVSRNGHELWAWSTDGSFRRYDVKSGNERQAFRVRVADVTTLAGSADNRLVIGNRIGDLSVYDTASGERRLPQDPLARISCVAVSASGSHVAVGTVDGEVRVWSADDGREVLRDTPFGDTPLEIVELSGDGTRLLVASGNQARLRNLTSSRVTFTIAPEDLASGARIATATLSRDGRLLGLGLTGEGPAFGVWDTVAKRHLPVKDIIDEPAAPHGGTLVRLGDAHAWLELVHRPGMDAVTLHVFGSEARESLRISAEQIPIGVHGEHAESGEPVELALALAAVANEGTGETVGDSATFRVQDDRLRDARNVRIELGAVTIHETTFEGRTVTIGQMQGRDVETALGAARGRFGGMAVRFSPDAKRAVCVRNVPTVSFPGMPATQRPWRVLLLDTSDLSGIVAGATVGLDQQPRGMVVDDDGNVLALTWGNGGILQHRIERAGVTQTGMWTVPDAAEPCVFTGDRHWVVAGRAGLGFTVFDATPATRGVAGEADMQSAWDRPVHVDTGLADVAGAGGTHEARDLVVVTSRNAVLHYRLLPEAERNRPDAPGNGDDDDGDTDDDDDGNPPDEG